MKFEITVHEIRCHDLEVEALNSREAQDKARIRIVEGHEPEYVAIEVIQCDPKKSETLASGRTLEGGR